MKKICKACNEEKEFGSNVNATTCGDCIKAGIKYCSQCGRALPLSLFPTAGKNAKGEQRYAGECKQCTKLRQANYYENNKEHIKAITNDYRKAHLEQYREYSKEFARRNPEKRKKQQIEASRRYAKTPHGRMKKLAYNEVYNRMAAIGDLTYEQWIRIVELFDNACAYCGSMDVLTVEHIIPVSHGGTRTAANVIPVCQHCNSSRGNKDIDEWLDTIAPERKEKILWYMNEGYKTIE